MKLKLAHETRYTYETPVRYSAQYLRLTPRDTARQKVLDWRLETPGQPVGTLDGYGNVLHVLMLDRPVSEIVIRSFGTVETSRSVDEPSDFTGTPLSPLLSCAARRSPAPTTSWWPSPRSFARARARWRACARWPRPRASALPRTPRKP